MPEVFVSASNVIVRGAIVRGAMVIAVTATRCNLVGFRKCLMHGGVT